MESSRRQFCLWSSGLGVGLFAGALRTYARSDLPTPDFTYDLENPPFIAGLRPFRKGSFRLEAERMGDKLVVHNYGHGGAGITLSWGVALEARDLVLAGNPAEREVAVIGAGVIGLTAAWVLTEAGFKVRVYAKGFCEETTSHVAGGKWAPSSVAAPQAGSGLTRFHRILERAYREHERRLGRRYGVSRKINYSWGRASDLERVPYELIGEPTFLQKLPFENHHASGYAYRTLLIDPPVLLRRLELDLREAGVTFERRSFSTVDEVLSLAEPTVINCLGLGAGKTFGDSAVVPIKGQLVMLPPQPELDYLYQGHGYIFPRSDAVVVGGSYDEGVTDPTPDPEKCREILDYARRAFEGREDGAVPNSLVNTP